jgi:antagonist of KipI
LETRRRSSGTLTKIRRVFSKHQTTGGYPKPANVISADFWRLGQLRPRDAVRFEEIAIEQAVELLRDQEQWLYSL